MALTDKQETFCQEYLKDLNGTQAAIRAGYSQKTAASIANENLTKPEIDDRIKELMGKREKRTEISVDKVLKDLEEIRDRCMQKEPVLDSEGKPTGEWKFASLGALKACELIGKHLKMFTDKVEHSGNIGLETLSDEELQQRLKALEDEK